MLNKNSMPAGILAALLFPVIALATVQLLKNNVYIINKPAVPYFAAIALNLLLLRLSLKKGADKTSRGIMLATFVFMFVVIIFKFHPIP